MVTCAGRQLHTRPGPWVAVVGPPAANMKHKRCGRLPSSAHKGQEVWKTTKKHAHDTRGVAGPPEAHTKHKRQQTAGCSLQAAPPLQYSWSTCKHACILHALNTLTAHCLHAALQHTAADRSSKPKGTVYTNVRLSRPWGGKVMLVVTQSPPMYVTPPCVSLCPKATGSCWVSLGRPWT